MVFYDKGHYRSLQGTVEMVDSIGRKLCLAGVKIPFEDLWEVKLDMPSA